MTTQNLQSNIRENIAKIIIDYTVELLELHKKYSDSSLPSNASDELKEHIKKIKALTSEALNELKTPTLRLAFVGATSSGKSTFVNALTGHRIMPMETGEMSAGIVKIHHDSTMGNAMRLNLDAPIKDKKEITDSDRPWNPIDKNDITQDCDIYNSLVDCMHSYHAKRYTIENLRAPNAGVWCNTFLGENKELLQLPEGVQLEFWDLPGIKEVSDSTNLSIVQQALGKNVLTLVMNYDDTAEERLDGLLEEIKKIINAFHGDTSMLLFVLNKIDHRMPSCDDPLDRKIDYLSERIRAALNLKEKPMIFPIKAQTFMLPQISLGQININNISEDDSLLYLSESVSQFRLKTIKDSWYRRELAGVCNDLYDEIQNVLINNSNAKINFHDGGFWEECAKDVKSVLLKYGDERIETILKAAMDESGISAYLNALRSRIEEHFARLVIQPAVNKLIDLTSQYVSEIKGECRISIENNNKELKKLLDNIEQTQKNVVLRITDINEKIEKEKDLVIKHLSSKVVSDRTKLMDYLKGTKELENDKCEFFNSVYDIFNIIDNDIQKNAGLNVQKPIQRYLNSNNFSKDSLTTCLKNNGISAYTCNKFIPLLETMKEHFSAYSSDIEMKKNDQNQTTLNKISNSYNECLKLFPKVISEYFMFALQIQSKSFEKTLETAVLKIRREMVDTIKKEISDKTIANSIVPAFGYIVQEVDMTFDSTLLPAPSLSLSSKNTTKIIETKRSRTIGEFIINILTLGLGYTPPEVKESHKEDYITLNLGTPDEFMKEMEKIIQAAKVALMQSVGEWFKIRSGNVIDKINEKSSQTLNGYQRNCKERQQEVERKINEKQDVWIKYQQNMDTVLEAQSDITAVIEHGYDAIVSQKKSILSKLSAVDGEDASTPPDSDETPQSTKRTDPI